MEVEKNEWWKIVEEVRKVKPGLPEYSCLLDYSLCPMSIMDDFTEEILELYYVCGGVSRVRSPREYYELPAVYREVCHVISGELSRIRKAQRGSS